jgi:hypothetical protein
MAALNARTMPLSTAMLLLSGCVVQSSPPPPVMPPLSADRAQPALALIEHVLEGHFAGPAALADPPTTCVELRPGGLAPQQEQALIARFPRLAPRDRCETEPPPASDGFTGEQAVVVLVHDFACSDAAHCAGWLNMPGSAPTRYAMTYEDGAWRIAGHPAAAQ